MLTESEYQDPEAEHSYLTTELAEASTDMDIDPREFERYKNATVERIREIYRLMREG